MIVSDKEKLLTKANDVCDKIVNLINKVAVEVCEDDPSENSYFFIHATSLLVLRVSIILENYSLIYGIENMTKEKVYEWIKLATDEYMESYSKEIKKVHL